MKNTKKFCKTLVDAPIKFLITQNKLKKKEDTNKSGTKAV
jgi:hypothetical protein